MIRYFAVCLMLFGFTNLFAQHNSGLNCLGCHSEFKIGGTVYTDSSGNQINPNVPILFLASDGSSFEIDRTNNDGNLYDLLIPANTYLVRLGNIQSKTWHSIPE